MSAALRFPGCLRERRLVSRVERASCGVGGGEVSECRCSIQNARLSNTPQHSKIRPLTELTPSCLFGPLLRVSSRDGLGAHLGRRSGPTRSHQFSATARAHSLPAGACVHASGSVLERSRAAGLCKGGSGRQQLWRTVSFSHGRRSCSPLPFSPLSCGLPSFQSPSKMLPAARKRPSTRDSTTAQLWRAVSSAPCGSVFTPCPCILPSFHCPTYLKRTQPRG